MRQISDEDRREIAKELREQFYCCRYAEERPDSWEKLEEDLDKDEGVCGYLEKCPKVMDKPSCSECRKLVLRDIASRVRKLRGEVREDA